VRKGRGGRKKVKVQAMKRDTHKKKKKRGEWVKNRGGGVSAEEKRRGWGRTVKGGGREWGG